MTDVDGNEIGKLFIGGLPQATSQETLLHYFSNFGEVEESVVMMDHRTGRSRGFGYVKFKDPAVVDVVMNSKPHILDGKEIDAKQCNVHMRGKNRRSLKIFVGGISLEHDEEAIRACFQQYGTVTDINLMMDHAKQRHRGFAFVGFQDENVVKLLIQMHYVTIGGKQVEIKAMEPPNFEKKFDEDDNNNMLNNTNGQPKMVMGDMANMTAYGPPAGIWRPTPAMAMPPNMVPWGMAYPTTWTYPQWQQWAPPQSIPTMPANASMYADYQQWVGPWNCTQAPWCPKTPPPAAWQHTNSWQTLPVSNNLSSSLPSSPQLTTPSSSYINATNYWDPNNQTASLPTWNHLSSSQTSPVGHHHSGGVQQTTGQNLNGQSSLGVSGRDYAETYENKDFTTCPAMSIGVIGTMPLSPPLDAGYNWLYNNMKDMKFLTPLHPEPGSEIQQPDGAAGDYSRPSSSLASFHPQMNIHR